MTAHPDHRDHRDAHAPGDRHTGAAAMTGVDVAHLRALRMAWVKSSREDDWHRYSRALDDASAALFDAAAAVDRVTALADEWENDGVRHVRGYVDTRLADLRAALVAPDNHNNKEASDA